MKRPLRAVPEPQATPAKHPEITPEAFIQSVLDRMSRDESRPVDYYRVAELCPPFSKKWIDDRLRGGELEAVTLHGVKLITGPSLRAFLQSAKTWEPPQ